MTKHSSVLSTAEAAKPNLDRRSFARGLGIAALAVGATAGVVQAEGALNPDAELLRLGIDLEAAWAAERAAENLATEAEFETLIEHGSEIVDRITVIPARNLEGFRIKARAVLWCHSGVPLADDAFSYDSAPTTDLILAASIVRDLLAIEGRPLGAFSPALPMCGRRWRRMSNAPRPSIMEKHARRLPTSTMPAKNGGIRDDGI